MSRPQLPLLACVISAGLAGSLPAFAEEAEAAWRVRAAEGEVAARSGAPASNWLPLSTNDRLPGAIEVATGPGSRAELTNGEITIALGPSGRLDLPDPRPRERSYRVVQHLGIARYDLRFRDPATFEVETQALVATATGSSLTVGADSSHASVHVTEGAAQVRPSAGGAAAAIGVGRTATMSASGQGLADPSEADAASEGEPRASGVPRSTVTVIDDGASPTTDALPMLVYFERVRAAVSAAASRSGAKPRGRNRLLLRSPAARCAGRGSVACLPRRPSRPPPSHRARLPA